MTLSPSDDRRTEGVDGPVYELNAVCPVPGCGTGSTLQRHHMWRKSDVIGDTWWVKTKDNVLHGNCVRICSFHHRELTDNIARIAYSEGVFYWKDVLHEPIALDWQPPFEQVTEHLSELISEVEALAQNGETLPLDEPKPTKKDEVLEDRDAKTGFAHYVGHDHPPELDYCPTCLRKLPRPKDESTTMEPKKVRKTWSCAVPMDLYENGADVIDTLLEEARVELARNGWPYGEGKVVRYYVLTAALGMFVTHAASLMNDE